VNLPVLGVLLAGGENRRYGSHKALARVGGRSILDRGLASLAEVTERIGIVANDPAPYRPSGRPVRPDVRPGTGVLGGLLTAVEWAGDEGCGAAVVLACDMPFVPGALLRRLAEEADPATVSVPASPGPRGLEPLCGVYGARTAAAIAAALDRGDRAVISFFDAVEVRILAPDEVRRFGAPERMFWNVNRPEDRATAEAWAVPPAAGDPTDPQREDEDA
jgi:molybdopterin-guanine dinucleotide biosynthesis protein A